ncbi:MAG: SLBB domain-containing protein [Oscillospiraceae bacterium]|nr:SLBB domain-containing protein [Oscillospiraceae bacterium]MBQ4644060.1 SLBB domain-containing protein [Oscillospiraceae bacterium]
MSLFVKGILPEQKKEPMLTRSTLVMRQEFEYFDCDFEETPVEDLSAEQITEIARLAEIVDECDGKMLWEKLEKSNLGEGGTLIIDAIDDEPYISSQMSICIHQPEKLSLGIELCEKVLSPGKTYIAMYRHILDSNFGIPGKIGKYKVRKIGGRYPAENRVYRHIPKGKNSVIVGACAMLHLARAAEESRKMTSCFVTVAGDVVKNPRNVEVPIGTTAEKVLELCGLSAEPETIVMGGSMTGRAIFEPENEVIVPTTRGVIALERSYGTYSYTCIGCGRCDHACPKALSVCALRKFADAGKFEELCRYDVNMCIGCGACSYVCPSRIDVAATLIKAKKQIELARKEGTL